MMSAKLNYTSYKPESIAGSKKGTKVAGIFALVILGIVSAIFLMYPSHNQLKPRESVHIVNVGESIWTIAQTQYPQVADEREVVYTIMEDNGLQDAGDLQVGQALKLTTITQ